MTSNGVQLCPDEIFEGEPSISNIDNDDFLNDTLTGAGTAHRCNWMFLQHLQQHLQRRSIGVQEYQVQDEDAHIKNAKTACVTGTD